MERKTAAGTTQYMNILETTGRLFLEHGYEGTSIRLIAKELDISPGLISYYFPAKKDIAVELFSRQSKKFVELVNAYVSEDDPILKSAVLIKLQITVLSSPVFKKLYMAALRHDIILSVICDSGSSIYQAINEKYNLGYTASYFQMNDLISASMERTLVLHADELQLEESVANLVFLSHMGRLYGTEEFMKQKCEQSDLVTAKIICEHPELLKDWL